MSAANVDDQILETAKALGIGEYPLNTADTLAIWKAHSHCDMLCMFEAENSFQVSISYLFNKFTVSSEGYKIPVSSIMRVQAL